MICLRIAPSERKPGGGFCFSCAITVHKPSRLSVLQISRRRITRRKNFRKAYEDQVRRVTRTSIFFIDNKRLSVLLE